MTDTTYTREQVTQAMSTAISQMNEVTDTAPARLLANGAWPELARLGDGPFTCDQVMAALNEVANALDEDIEYENSDTIWAQDVRNLFVNAMLHQLVYPGASLQAAIRASYRDSDPDEVLGWVS
jgi:hypothetical protein